MPKEELACRALWEHEADECRPWPSQGMSMRGGEPRSQDSGWGMIRLIRCAVLFLCCLAIPLTMSCTSHKEVGSPLAPDEVTPEAEAILHVGQAYRDAYAALKKPPASTKDLKPYLTKFGDPDKALISPSDGQPYEITWEVVPGHPPRSMKVSPFLVSEKSGKNGKRYVLDFTFKVRCLTEGEFEKLRGGAQ